MIPPGRRELHTNITGSARQIPKSVMMAPTFAAAIRLTRAGAEQEKRAQAQADLLKQQIKGACIDAPPETRPFLEACDDLVNASIEATGVQPGAAFARMNLPAEPQISNLLEDIVRALPVGSACSSWVLPRSRSMAVALCAPLPSYESLLEHLEQTYSYLWMETGQLLVQSPVSDTLRFGSFAHMVKIADAQNAGNAIRFIANWKKVLRQFDVAAIPRSDFEDRLTDANLFLARCRENFR